MSESGRRPADGTGRLAVVIAVRSIHATLWVEAVARALMSTGFIDLSLAVLEAAPAAKTVPQIWLDGDYIGGHDDLVKHLS